MLKVKPKTTEILGVADNSNIERQFEAELCWCIQQLQCALRFGKLNSKQGGSLNVLMSNSTPLVKKRQIMRLSFGDYRSKMAEESKRLKTMTTQVKLSTGNPSNKSVFVKKAIPNEAFKFNFDVNNLDEDNAAVTQIHDTNTAKETKNFQFVPSNNEFRFHFNVTE